MKKKNYLIASLGLTLTLIPNKAEAKEIGLGVYPPLTRITANINTEVNTPLTIVNTSENEILVDIKLAAFKSSAKNNGTIDYMAKNDVPSDISSFLDDVKIKDGDSQIKSIKLYPKEYKKLNLFFTAPNTHEKDYYFSVVFSSESTTRPGGDSKDTIANIHTSLASNVLLSVNPSQNPTAHINELSSTKFVLSGNPEIKLLVGNTSSNFTSASGTLSIYNMFGKKIQSLQLKKVIILADSERYMTTGKAAKGNEKIIISNQKLLGIYTAKATIKINDFETISQQTSFISIPLFVVLIVTIALFIVLSILYKVIKKLNFKEA